MPISTPVYATREDVKRALDFKETARNNDIVDRSLETSARSVEGLLRRRFYPEIATRYFPWPNTARRSLPWRLWLDADELISASAVSSGGVTIASTDYFLEPVNTGPPYASIEIDLSSSAAFSAGSTYQRGISIAGTFGHSANTAPAGALAGAISSASATTCAVTDSGLIGVGQLIKVDSEYMLVTNKTSLTTGQTVQTTALTALASNESLIVTTGSAYAVGEVVTVDAERMLVVDITSNTLTVKRAWDGSTLAAHNTGVTIYAPRTLTVVRGFLGSTAATHLDAASVLKHVVPSLVRTLSIAESCAIVVGEPAAWSGGGGGGATEAAMANLPGIPSLRAQAKRLYGRKMQARAV